MGNPTINVNLDKKCERCGQGGVVSVDGAGERFCMACVAKEIGADIFLGAKLKTLKQKPESDEEVTFSLVLQLDAAMPEAQRLLELGATLLWQEMDVRCSAPEAGFERRIRAAEMTKLAGAATEDATVKVDIEIATKADLDEMKNLWADFLPRIKYPLQIHGVVVERQGKLAL